MKSPVNQRIEIVMKFYNLTVTSFARSLSVSQPTMKAIIDGDTKPSFDTIEKLLNIYSICANWLILGLGEMERKEIKTEDETVLGRLEFLENIVFTITDKLGMNTQIVAEPILKYKKSNAFLFSM